MKRRTLLWTSIVITNVTIGIYLYVIFNYPRGGHIESTITKDYPTSGYQLVKNSSMSIITPLGWSHEAGFDCSVFGKLITETSDTMFYDITFAGGAVPLVFSEDESIRDNAYRTIRNSLDSNACYYSHKNMKILSRRKPCPEHKREFIAKVELCDSTFEIHYNLDPKFRYHLFDSLMIGEYYFTLVTPKETGRGITGIHGVGISFWGRNLTKNTEKEFIKALKTLDFAKLKK